MHREEEFIKYRKSIQVAPYALADVIEALTNDSEHFVDIVVTKEDGQLVVMFNRTHKSCRSLNKGLADNVPPEEDESVCYPTHGDPVLCDMCDITTTSAGENNTNMTTRQTCETLY